MSSVACRVEVSRSGNMARRLSMVTEEGAEKKVDEDEENRRDVGG